MISWQTSEQEAHELDEVSHFFIFGNPRSGTSLLRSMLHNHPLVCVPAECGFAEWLIEGFATEAISEHLYGDFAEAVVNCRKFETWGLEKNAIENTLFQLSPRTYREMCIAVYLAYANKIGKRAFIVGDKNNYYLKKIDKLKTVFPQSREIVIMRDGRDVACSYLALRSNAAVSEYHPRLPTSIDEIARDWRESAEICAGLVESGAILIRYEDLLAQPVQELSKACKRLGVEYHKNMLDFYANFDEPVEFQGWKGSLRKPILQDNKGKYLAELSRAQLDVIESIAGDMLESFGYK